MILECQQLYLFLTACSGNWRNTIYVPSLEERSPAYLLAFDRDTKPILMPVDQLQQYSDVLIDPAECCGQLMKGRLKDLFAQYLIWQTELPQDCPLPE